MRSTNRVSLIGNLGSDVEIKAGEDGTSVPVARLSVAEHVDTKNEVTGVWEWTYTNWIPVTAFGSLALRAARDLKKGDRIAILGTLKTSQYEKDGKKLRSFEVLADSIEKSQILSAAVAPSATPFRVTDTKRGALEQAPHGGSPRPARGSPDGEETEKDRTTGAKAPVVVPKQSAQLTQGGMQTVQAPRAGSSKVKPSVSVGTQP